MFICSGVELSLAAAARSSLTILAVVSDLSTCPAAAVPLVCAVGQFAEQAFYGSPAYRLIDVFLAMIHRYLASICFSPCSSTIWLAHYAGTMLFTTADVLIGSGKHNLVHECAALNVLLLSLAVSRLC
ncbi:hypothetical protein IFO70_06780 [Phormidium tenue FACHB-886]|nr:hypothetical protein [Phormidium tenue FACHB-886]